MENASRSRPILLLVAVSENALGDFQRRSFGFRNVFDSTFDDIVTVPYLTADQSVRLLDRRIIGMPVLFALLCHCLSGGLARDLIRVARSLIELGTDGETNLAAAAESLVGRELASSADAVVLGRRLSPPDPTETALIRWLHRRGDHTGAPLLDRCRELLHALARAGGADQRDPVAGRGETLVLEVLALTYYCATVVDLFTGRAGEDVLDELGANPEAVGIVDDLAQASQALPIHPAITWDTVSTFRARYGLEVLLLPDLQMGEPNPAHQDQPHIRGIS